MAEPEAEVFAQISAEADRTWRAWFTPVEIITLKRLAKQVRLEHPVFGALELQWVFDIDKGIARRTAATVMIIGKRAHTGTWQEVTALTPLDGKHLLEVARESREVAIRMLAMLARHALIEHATHEIDEMLLVSGERLFDPHGPNAASTPDLAVTSDQARAFHPQIREYGVND